MSKFFSLVSDGKGKAYYFNWELRSRCLKRGDYNPDSHSSIATYFGFTGKKGDAPNKYEYNPLTGRLTINEINTTDDSEEVATICRKLDFRTIVPQFITKRIVHPFNDVPKNQPTKQDIELLMQWASIEDSATDSICASVDASIGAAVGYPVCVSVRNSVWFSGCASIWSAFWAYVGSFFALDEWKYVNSVQGIYPFQPAVTLWEKGLVPACDGKVWRLHSGDRAEIVWEGK